MKEKQKRQVRNGIAFNGKTFSYVLRVPDPLTGRTKPQWVGGFQTEKEAKLARDKARVAIGNRVYTPPTKLTLNEYLDAWLQTKQVGLSTLERAIGLCNHYIKPKLGEIKLQDLKPFHIQSLYKELSEGVGVKGNPLSKRTIRYIGQILKEALNYAVEVDNLISVNPAQRIKLPVGVSNTPAPFSTAELNQFLETAKSHRLYFYFRLSAYTGARRGELLALRWTDFDGTALTLNKSRVRTNRSILELNKTKGGANHQRRVPLDAETIAQLTEHRKRQIAERLALGEHWQDTGYIFTQENGLPIHPDTATRIFGKLIKKAGLRHNRLHDTRHTHATELLRAGEPLHVVAHRLGHRDAMVTATIYAHVDTEQSVSASETFAKAMRNA
jgi:integrase